MSREDAWSKFKLQFNSKSKKKIEEHTEKERAQYFDNYFTPAFTYKALNRLVQGSAADMTKKAMVLLYEKGIVPHIQIHDELCLSIDSEEKAAVVKETMEKALILLIPNKVNYKKGENWGTIK
jgi:DNA polymerase I-like protein with 3'-5' exonuclease and polymerase domains